MNACESENVGDEAREERLDALLRSQALVPPVGFSDSVLRRIEEANSAVDATVDVCLARQSVRARPERVEMFFRGVLHHARVRNIVYRFVPALAACFAVLLALHVAIPRNMTSAPGGAPSAGSSEEIINSAMDADPALAAMLRVPAGDSGGTFVWDPETVEAISGLNDNTLAWLETLTLTSYENEPI